jgi:hypothetical protein
MPLYYFHMTNGIRAFRDYEGVELPDLRAARSYALADARDAMRHDRSGSDEWSLWTFEITDEKGAYALTVPFSDAESDNGTNGGVRTAFQSWPRGR